MSQRQQSFGSSIQANFDEVLPSDGNSLSRPSPFRNYGKNAEDDEQFHATPSTHNPAVDDSIILQQSLRRKCIGCIDTEKKVYEMELELKNQTRKNLRYLKIINIKIDKEKELQRAYTQIAQQLKKRIEIARAREQAKQQQTEMYEKQSAQMKVLNSKIQHLQNRLSEANQKLKDSLEALDKIKTTIIIEKKNDPSDQPTQAQNLNLYYQQQISQLNQKIFQLESRMKLQQEQLISSQKAFNRKSHTNSKINQIEKSALKESQSVPQLAGNQKASNKSQDASSPRNTNPYPSYYHKNSDSVQILKPFNMSKISSIEAKNDHSDLDNIMNDFQEQQSFKTINEWPSSSFYSISNLQPKNNQQNYQNILDQQPLQRLEQLSKIIDESNSQFYSIDPLEDDLLNISQQKQPDINLQEPQIINQQNISNESQKISNVQPIRNEDQQLLMLIQQNGKQRKSFAAFALSVQNLFLQLEKSLNSFGQSYNISFKFPSIPNLSQMLEIISFGHFQKLIFTNDIIEKTGRDVVSQLSTLIKLIKKSYEKRLNDQELQLGVLRSKLNHEDEEKRNLGKIVEKLQQHNTRLQYKISQTEDNLSSEKSIRDVYLRSMLKKKSSLCISKSKEEFAQCDILASNTEQIRQAQMCNYQKIVQALLFIPNCFNQNLKKKDIKCELSIDLDKDLETQIEQLVKKAFNLLQIQNTTVPSSNFIKKIRSSSFSSKDLHEAEDKGKSKTQFILQMQYNRLQNTLKQKNQKIVGLNQTITIQKIEKTQLEGSLQRLTEEVQHLKASLANASNAFTPTKTNNRQSSKRDTAKEITQQSGEFADYEQKIEFNNLYWDKDEQLKSLREKNEFYKQELKKYEMQIRKRKKKIVYINN